MGKVSVSLSRTIKINDFDFLKSEVMFEESFGGEILGTPEERHVIYEMLLSEARIAVWMLPKSSRKTITRKKIGL